MIKKLFCFLWGHKIFRWNSRDYYHPESGELFTSRQQEFYHMCPRCGKRFL